MIAVCLLGVMTLPTLHLIAPFHTVPTLDFSHCAFTGKALRFSKMMQMRGYRVVEYANEGSTSDAETKVVMLNREEFAHHYPTQKAHEFHGDYAKWGIRGWPIFNQRLIVELAKRAKPGDIVCHPFGQSHQMLPTIFPHLHHVETGIGYPDRPFGCWRIFESNAWRHYHWGRDDKDDSLRNNPGMNRSYSWVIPNYFDLDDWIAPDEPNEDYVLYMGRITAEKGMRILVEVIRAMAKLPNSPAFVFAGQGDFQQLVHSQVFRDPHPGNKVRLRFAGVVTGRHRAALVGKARGMVMPTEFIEPFGGAGVEGMLTGTPLLASGFGAFTETVEHGITGFHCNTLGDWITGIEHAKSLNRDVIRLLARSRFSLADCGLKYDRAFREIAELSRLGWNHLSSFRVGPLETTGEVPAQ